jgi:hypothetical protein
MGPIIPIIPFPVPIDESPFTSVALEVHIKAKKEDIFFHPAKTTITNSAGETFHPTMFIGPVQLGKGSFTFLGNRTNHVLPEAYFRNPTHTTYCYVLDYDMENSPDWNISMKINGIQSGSQFNETPVFEFKRGKGFYYIIGGREMFCDD